MLKKFLFFVLAIFFGAGVYLLAFPFVPLVSVFSVTSSSSSCEISDSRRTVLSEYIRDEMSSFRVLDDSISVRDLEFVGLSDTPDSTTSISTSERYDWDNPRVVLLNLWATWCAPCREEMPSLDELSGSLSGADFAVIPVSLDTGSITKPRAFYESIGLRHLPLYHDPSLSVLDFAKRHGLAFGLPSTFLIESGCVLGVLSGPAEWSSPVAKDLIRTIL